MIADVEDGRIGTVIVKDMSRVGRDYLQTGFYTEVYFAKKGVRFIAIDSHVDNMSRDSNEFAPLLNVFNEMYLHDQSRKERIAFRAKGMSGRSLASVPPFGYRKDPKEKDAWMVDPVAADTVRRAFTLAANGHTPSQIAVILRDEMRMTRSAYFDMQGIRKQSSQAKANKGQYGWDREAVVDLLRNRAYMGDTVNFKTAQATYKSKRTQVPENERMVFENTHEPLVDRKLGRTRRPCVKSGNTALLHPS